MSMRAPTSERSPGIPVHEDVEDLFACINGIRIAYTRAGDRQPLSFDDDERRGSARVPLHIPVQVTPVEFEGGEVRLLDNNATFAAESTNLSLRGMGFLHSAPCQCRHAAVTFQLPAADTVALLVEMRWTRPEPEDRLHSGTRFLGIIDLPPQLSRRSA